MRSTLDNLQSMRRVLDAGWVKGEYYTGEGVCLVGAVRFSPRDLSTTEKEAAFKALYFALPESHRGGEVLDSRIQHYGYVAEGSLITYNDAPARTKEEVLAVIDRAIEKEKQA